MNAEDQLLLALKPYDLVRLGKSLRVVRSTTVGVSNVGTTKGFLTFSILRCSWTTRPYTVISAYEAKARGIELVGRNVKLKHGLSDLLDQDVNRRGAGPSVLKACDVVGVLR